MFRQTLSEYGMKRAQRIVCVDCGLYWNVSDDTDIIKTYGKRPLCWPCLQKRKDNEMDVNMDKEPRIEKRLRKYLDYLSDNNPTTRNYDKMVLARAIVEDHSSTFDRIDK